VASCARSRYRCTSTLARPFPLEEKEAVGVTRRRAALCLLWPMGDPGCDRDGSSVRPGPPSGPTLLTSWTVATASWRTPVGRRRDRAYPQRISGRHASTVAPRKQPANRRRDLDPSRLEAPGSSGLLCVWVQVQRCPSVRPGQPIWLTHGSNPRLFLRLSLSVVFTKRCFGR
jgi:hypothetical protein